MILGFNNCGTCSCDTLLIVSLTLFALHSQVAMATWHSQWTCTIQPPTHISIPTRTTQLELTSTSCCMWDTKWSPAMACWMCLQRDVGLLHSHIPSQAPITHSSRGGKCLANSSSQSLLWMILDINVYKSIRQKLARVRLHCTNV